MLKIFSVKVHRLMKNDYHVTCCFHQSLNYTSTTGMLQVHCTAISYNLWLNSDVCLHALNQWHFKYLLKKLSDTCKQVSISIASS